jgi:hypothetical protein
MNKICAAIITLTLVAGLSMSSFAQKRRRQNAVFIGGGAASGAVINQNVRSRSNSRKVVKGRKIIGTTYGGDGETNLRKRVRR